MKPLGFSPEILDQGVSWGTISQYTWHSRTLLAMNMLYGEPKSKMTTASRSAPGATPFWGTGRSPLFSLAISR